jgi:hypothetical protein
LGKTNDLFKISFLKFESDISDVGLMHEKASTRARHVAVDLYPVFSLWRNKFWMTSHAQQPVRSSIRLLPHSS